MRQILKMTVLFILLLCVVIPTFASSPQLINYQGRLTNASDVPLSGSFSILFTIWSDPSGGSNLWSETQSVTATNGLFSTALGSVTVLPASVFNDTVIYLGIKIGTDPELTPRTRLIASPYSRQVETIDGATGGSIYGNVDIVGSLSESVGSNSPGGLTGISALVNNVSPSASAIGGDFRVDADPGTTAFYRMGVQATATGSSSGWLEAVAAGALNNGTGLALGVNGQATNTSSGAAIAGQFYCNGDGTGPHTGSWSYARGTNNVYGVMGNAVADGSSTTYAGYFQASNFLGSTASIYGLSSTANGASTCYGLWARADGTGTNYAIYGTASGGATNYAGYFSGPVTVTGFLSKLGGGFRIDHPLDPANKYLQHSFVESPDMKNFYDGVVTLDGRGEATITMPDWFGEINKDFRYQLTCIGGYAPVYIAKEYENGKFSIAGGKPGLKVSWAITGIRKDVWAEQNRMEVEMKKPADEIGKYLYAKGFGQSDEFQIGAMSKDEKEKMEQARASQLVPQKQ